LLIAAIVSIALGIYEDFGMEHEPTLRYNRNFTPYYAIDPKISWVEGVAILAAVIIVVLVGSINDYQKEAQFRKLNAKKEDREVKVKYTSCLYCKLEQAYTGINHWIRGKKRGGVRCGIRNE